MENGENISTPAVSKKPRILIYVLSVLVALSVILLGVLVRDIHRGRQMRQRIESLLKKSVDLGEQIDTQQQAVVAENKAIAEELKKPLVQQPVDLQQRLKVNADRADAIQALLKEQQQTLETLYKAEQELGIVPKEQNKEAKAVLEKY